MVLFSLEDSRDIVLRSRADRVHDREHLGELQITKSMNASEQRRGRTTYRPSATWADLNA